MGKGGVVASSPTASRTKVLTRRERDGREDAVCKIRTSSGREGSGTLVELAGYTAILTCV